VFKIINQAIACFPAPLARAAKRLGVFSRYWIQRKQCADGYKEYGQYYPQTILFIAGLPKSGTTWLKKMLCSYPGLHEILILDVASYEIANSGSHDYELPHDIFSRFKDLLVVTKMHVHGSIHNVGMLHNAGLKYIIMYRDLRDVAISYYFYVCRTRWHPEYSIYSQLSLEDGLQEFSNRLLPEYVEWIRSWHENRDPKMSLEIKYEQLLADPVGEFRKIAIFWGLDSSTKTIDRIIAENNFKKLSGGRERGQHDVSNFFRKGISGDWKNHFTSEIKDQYKPIIGDFLIEFGYELDYSW